MRHKLELLFFTFVLVVLCREPFRMFFSEMSHWNMSFLSHTASEKNKAFARSTALYRLLAYMDKSLADDAYILTFRQADTGYYIDRKFLYYLDPKLSKIYSAQTEDQIYRELNTLGVTHIVVPGYGVPHIYNTLLADFIADPAFVDLQFDAGGYRLFQIRKAQVRLTERTPVRLDIVWSQSDPGHIRTHIPQEILAIEQQDVLPGAVKETYSGAGTLSVSPEGLGGEIKVHGGYLYKIDSLIEGESLAAVSTFFYSQKGLLSSRRGWFGVVSGEKKMSFLVRAPADSRYLRLVFGLNGTGNLKVKELTVSRYDDFSISAKESYERSAHLWSFDFPKGSGVLLDWGLKKKNEKNWIFIEGKKGGEVFSLKSEWFHLPALDGILKIKSLISGCQELKVLLVNKSGSVNKLVSHFGLSENELLIDTRLALRNDLWQRQRGALERLKTWISGIVWKLLNFKFRSAVIPKHDPDLQFRMEYLVAEGKAGAYSCPLPSVSVHSLGVTRCPDSGQCDQTIYKKVF